MNKKLTTLIALVLIVTFSSCSKFLEDYSPNLVTVRSLTDLDEVLIGSVYIPSNQMTYTTNNKIASWLNYVDDDVNTVTGASAATNPIGPQGSSAQMNYMYGYTTWQYDVSKSYDKTTSFQESGTWKDLYARINICNIILNEIEHIVDIKEKDRPDYHRIKAETLFLRAQFYFMLVNIYGEPYSPATAGTTLGVPLKLTHFVEHVNKVEQQFERTTLDKIYEQIKKDLKESIDNFALGSIKQTTLRANQKAAMVLLSRVGLYTEDYTLAKEQAETVITEMPILQPLPVDNTTFVFFNRENQEVFFSQGSLNFQTSFIGAPRDFCVSMDLRKLYANEDKRLRVFFGISRYSDSTVLNNKYIRGMHISYVSDQFLIRSGEAYLNAAEAAAMSNDEVTANRYLNALKTNRINSYTDQQLSGRALVDEIRDERRRELCFEGHRWFDLRRYSVNSIHPYAKAITRSFNVYTNNGNFVQLEEYILQPNDPAYTLQIPADVREFQPGMPINKRVVREPSKVINIKF